MTQASRVEIRIVTERSVPREVFLPYTEALIRAGVPKYVVTILLKLGRASWSSLQEGEVVTTTYEIMNKKEVI